MNNQALVNLVKNYKQLEDIRRKIFTEIIILNKRKIPESIQQLRKTLEEHSRNMNKLRAMIKEKMVASSYDSLIIGDILLLITDDLLILDLKEVPRIEDVNS